MHPDAAHLWRGPRWTLAVLLACLGMLAPFAIDTYLPAFAGIAGSLDATPLQMQQTLSAYLFGFAAMNLFHGALADSFGRRRVVLWGMAAFTISSAGCALSPSIGALVAFRALQGLASGAGTVVSRAIIRDLFPPAEAQKVMSQVTIFFGIAPAVAPLIGGWLFEHLGWASIFWYLTAVGVVLWLAVLRFLPETLHVSQVQAFRPRPLLAGYRSMAFSPRFMTLVLASGIPFNGMFLYVMAAPVFLGEHLQLAPTQYFWFFVCNIVGIMGGAWLSGRLAGRIAPHRQIRHGFVIMTVVSALNVTLNALLPVEAWWAVLVITMYSFGWALMVPVVTLLVLDQVPERRGMASSMQACIGAVANGIVAGVVAPLVMHSTLGLALTSAALMAIGVVAWLWVRARLPPAGPPGSS